MTADIDLGIDHLEDVTEVGRGGFSVVYSATHGLFKRPMAVKVLNRLSKESERRRFERECEVMGRLSDHPNVVSVYNAGYTEAGQPYLLMQLVRGGSLDDRLQERGRLPWREAVAVALPICAALERAHADDVLHRDVKPENILLDGDTPLLADFGIASLRDATGATSTHITASMAHTAPETFENKRDERSDLYSLASTLYAVIVGGAPFWREGDTSLHPMMNRLLNEAPPGIPPGLAPPELSDLLRRTLAKDPAQRPQSAAELGRLLREVADGAGTGSTFDPGGGGAAGAAPSSEPPVLLGGPASPFRAPGTGTGTGPSPRDAWAPTPAGDAGAAGGSDPWASAAVPAGWYPAPGDPPGTHRYWSGEHWDGGPRPLWSTSGPTPGGTAAFGAGPSGPVPGGPALAGGGARIGARLVDWVIWFVFWMMAALPAYWGDEEEFTDTQNWLVLAMTSAAATVLIVSYEVVMVALRGGTIGKLLFGLRVVREDGAPMTNRTALVRQSLNLAVGVATALLILPIALGWLLALVGLVMVLANDRRQAPWDKLAHTLVVRVA